MASGFQCGVIGLTDATGVPAVAALSPNLRVRTATGFIATVADVVQFPGPTVIGTWLLPATRCLAGGVPLITQASAGMGYTLVAGVPTPSGPLQITAPDPRAQGS
jgi:hypothetical protein